MKRFRTLQGLLVLILCFAYARAEESGKDALKPVTPLGVRQDHVKRMMQELDQKFVDLARALEKTEPAQAKKLIEALQQSKELTIEARMAKVAQALNQTQFDSATDEQRKVIVDLRHLVDILLDDGRMDELKRLERWKDELNKLIPIQDKEKRDSEKLSDKDKTAMDLAKQAAAVEALIKKEKEVIDQTNKARTQGVQGLGKVADQQGAVRKETQDLAKEIAKANGDQEPKDAGKDSGKDAGKDSGKDSGKDAGKDSGKDAGKDAGKDSGKDAGKDAGKDSGKDAGKDAGKDSGKDAGKDAGKDNGKPSPPMPGSPMPGSPTPGSPMPGSPSPGSPSPGSPSPGSPSPGSPSPGSPSPGSPSPGSPSPGSPSAAPEPGQKPLEKAAEKQQNAEKDLGDGKAKAAEGHENEALKELEKALAEIKKEQKRIASLPDDAGDQLAKKQDDTKDDTKKLEDEMKKADEEAGGGPPSAGKPGEGDPSGGQPGEDDVKEAQKDQQQASNSLKKKDPKAAAKQQKSAKKKLQDARDKIEERLAQLRKEMQLEKLAALEARFREMLARQKPVTTGTVTVDKQRVDGKLSRPNRLALVKFADEEKIIGEMAQKALDIIVEDGTSVVFAQVTAGLRDDLRGVSELIHGEHTDKYTQNQQIEIEKTLNELIEALQKAQEDSPPMESPPSDSKPKDDPLLPNSAELKLLKAAQLRVNRRTESFEQARPATLDELQTKEVHKIAKRQEDVVQMTDKLNERQ